MTSPNQLRQALAAANPDRLPEITRQCLAAINAGLFEEVVAKLAPLVEAGAGNNFRLWQCMGLAHRGLQNSAGAHRAFQRAAQFEPQDPLIAHSLARTALEAGYPSAELFSRARRLAPKDASVLLGQAAALLAEGNPQRALAELADLLEQNPGWSDGHAAFARISAMTEPQADSMASLRRAVAQHPDASDLWARLIETAMHANAYQTGLECIEAARRAVGASNELDRAEAICRNENGDPAGARAIFDRLPDADSARVLVHPVRNLIRLERFAEACRLADRALPAFEEHHLWPYRALLWRVTEDPRWEWLEGDSRFIGQYDLSGEIGSLGDLAAVLRTIHHGTGAPIDQSVRGGTQTDGNLLARAEPEIRKLRSALIEAVQTHVAQLPPPRQNHPTLLQNREPIRVEGAWSVRLVSEGFHVDHVHPQGWLSSAFYVGLPESGVGTGDGAEAGWLTFGECRTLLPELAAFRTIEPRCGQLALFPSTMWHGTRRFRSGERLTVAFDIGRPLQ